MRTLGMIVFMVSAVAALYLIPQIEDRTIRNAVLAVFLAVCALQTVTAIPEKKP
jgi:4-amino-4-deoxy-L-arabinose transferase-like glycosyltransferase